MTGFYTSFHRGAVEFVFLVVFVIMPSALQK